jgi:nicotinate-nucleotide--dimethylbenzimidazole phosphoribosyltransferase
LIQFDVEPASAALAEALKRKVDNKTKPQGSLGKLEQVAIQIGCIQNTQTPRLNALQLVVFAADHGIAQSGVSAYPPEVTQQMVLNFLRGGAAINVFCRINNIQLHIVDAGINADLAPVDGLVDAKIAHGTRNILEAPAMTREQCEQAIAAGAAQVQHLAKGGSNVFAFGEMGIGNTSAAALLVSALTLIPLEQSAGRGTGLDDAGYNRKLKLLQQALNLHPVDGHDPLAVLATFGGFEIAMMCGAFLQAAEQKLVILVDGYIATAAVLVASRLYPEVLDYCIFTHCSGEQGHQPVLKFLGVEPLVDLQMRLGEGSGAAVVYPLVEAAVAFLNQMASFDDAGVSRGPAD